MKHSFKSRETEAAVAHRVFNVRVWFLQECVPSTDGHVGLRRRGGESYASRIRNRAGHGRRLDVWTKRESKTENEPKNRGRVVLERLSLGRKRIWGYHLQGIHFCGFMLHMLIGCVG